MGSIWEGGCTREIYADKEDAIKFAYMLVNEQIEERKKMWDDLEDQDMFPQWTEKEASERIIKRWDNSTDEIYILEYELK